MRNTFDQSTDFSHKELYAFLNNRQVPEFVKNAELSSTEDLNKLPGPSFADPFHRLFPIDNPANTFISEVYFTNKQAELQKKYGQKFTEEIGTRLKQAAELHKISVEVENYRIDNEKRANADYSNRHLLRRY